MEEYRTPEMELIEFDASVNTTVTSPVDLYGDDVSEELDN